MTIRKQRKSFPKYQIHKASNRAFVWWRDKRHYLGAANSHESLEAYNRFIAEIARTKGLFNPTDRESRTIRLSQTLGVGRRSDGCLSDES